MKDTNPIALTVMFIIALAIQFLVFALATWIVDKCFGIEFRWLQAVGVNFIVVLAYMFMCGVKKS
jgi:hypothetical protein